MVIEKVDSMSQRECEKVLFELSPEPIADDSTRTVSKDDDRELKFVVSREIYDELQELKGLLAHQIPDASYAELLKFLLKETLPRVKKKRGIEIQEKVSIQMSSSSRQTAPVLKNSHEFAVTAELNAAAIVLPPPPLPKGVRVYLPAHIRKEVWRKSGGQCEMQTQQGRSCTSKYRLEIDHRHPLALNGSNDLSNLWLLCRHHNVQQALRAGISREG